MTTWQLVIVCLTVLLGLLILVGNRYAAGELASTAEHAPSLVGATVVVNTRKPDDQSIRGIVAAHHADRLTLLEAIYLAGGAAGASRSADGLVHVPLATVSSVQEIVVTAPVALAAPAEAA